MAYNHDHVTYNIPIIEVTLNFEVVDLEVAVLITSYNNIITVEPLCSAWPPYRGGWS